MCIKYTDRLEVQLKKNIKFSQKNEKRNWQKIYDIGLTLLLIYVRGVMSWHRYRREEEKFPKKFHTHLSVTHSVFITLFRFKSVVCLSFFLVTCLPCYLFATNKFLVCQWFCMWVGHLDLDLLQYILVVQRIVESIEILKIKEKKIWLLLSATNLFASFIRGMFFIHLNLTI